MTPTDDTAAVLTRLSRVAAARVTLRSWLDTLASSDATVCVLDDRFGEVGQDTFDDPRITMVSPTQLSEEVGPVEFRRVMAALDGPDRVVALRPSFLSFVARQRPGRVVTSLPDDTWIRAGFSTSMPAGAVLSLVGRRSTTAPTDGRLPDAIELAALGRVDQELFCVGPDAGPLLAWWSQRVQRSPRVHLDRLLPWRHPWLDDLIAHRDVYISSDPRVDVAYWNADERLDISPTLLRFPGFDPHAPWRLTDRAAAWPRVLLSEHPHLADLAISYARDLMAAGQDAWSVHPNGWSVLANGTIIDVPMRAAYLRALQHAEGTGEPEPPSPFDHPNEFIDWIATEAPGDGASRYLRSLASTRADLRGLKAGELLHWSRNNARREGANGRLLADGYRQSTRSTSEPASTPLPGINVIGLMRAEFGMGEAARLTVQAVEASDLPFSVVVVSETAHRQHHDFGSNREVTMTSAMFDTDVVVLNADVMQHRQRRAGRRTVGVWFWEVERFPRERYAQAIDNVDEIWVASEHVRRAVQDAVSGIEGHRPVVRLFPLPAATPRQTGATSTGVLANIPSERFVFLFVFDYASVAERKNPWGLVEAFITAFPQQIATGPILVVKSVSGDHHLDDRERLRAAARDRTDVILYDGFSTPDETSWLMARADCYVSLHRAEGWGLTLAEAMALGKPVIATKYSGNLDFMNEANSWLIPASLIAIPPHIREYSGCGRWAQPDLDSAVTAMREVVADPTIARVRGEIAAADLARRTRSESGAEFLRRCFNEWNVRPDSTETEPTMAEPEERPTEDPAARDPDRADEIGPLDHPGLGPVVLPAQPPVPTTQRGGLQRLGLGTDEQMQQWRDTRDHERTVALVRELTETRAAIAEESKQRRRDQSKITGWFEGVRSHVTNLQAAHDSVAASAANTATRLSAHDEVLFDLHNMLKDLKVDLTRIEARLADITRVLEARAPAP